LVRREGTEAVAKVVFLDNLKDRDRALALQEVEVLKRFQHPNIVRHYASWLHRSSPSIAGQEALVNVMEYCAGGDLRNWLESCLRNGEQLPEPLVLSLFAQMVAGMRYVHEAKVLHRDLKTSNMLLDAERRVVKIGDFGIARVLETTTAVALTMLGTPYYMSPEVCRGEPYHQKSDMWSLGCVLYEMCVLRHAFESQSLLGLVYCIVSEHYDPIPSDRYGDTVRELVAQLLAKPAEERPSADQVLALEVLRPYCGSDGEPLELPAAAVAFDVPPPPPPKALDGPGAAPEPPPSPRSREEDAEEELPLSAHSPVRWPSPSAAPPPPQEPPPGRAVASALPAFPHLRRAAAASAASTAAGGWFEPTTARPPPGPLHELGSERCISPPRGAAAVAAAVAASPPGRQNLRSGAQMPATPWAEAGYETQVLLARARGALLRRPRARGNWVQAFALHDVTGNGLLGCAEFAAFLQSLSLGLSRREAFMVTECLLGETRTVSLGGFSEAITHASPSDPRFDEAWALETACALAGGAPGGLATFAGRSAAEALVERHGDHQLDVERFTAWLPKGPDGDVDWAAAEEWRTSAASDRRR